MRLFTAKRWSVSLSTHLLFQASSLFVCLGHLCEQGELNGPVALHIIVLTLLVCSGYEAAMFHTRTYNHLLV